MKKRRMLIAGMILFVSLVTMPLWANNVAQENVSLTDQNTTDYTNPPINRVERLSRRFQHPKREMDFTEKWDILSERMEHHKRERTGAQKQSFSDDIEPEWVTHYASGLSPAIDVATDIAVDNFGNVYVTGYSSGLPFGLDYFTAKYDASGNQIWTVRYDNSGDDLANAIAVDGSGNVYVTGYSYGSDTETDYATVKYNSAGVEEWVARYNGPGNSGDEATSIAVDGSGNVYVTGGSYGSDTEYDYATVKYNSAGVEEWVARYNGPGNSHDYATAIAVDGSGNVYVTGGRYGSDTETDYATVKYNSGGAFQWLATYDGPGNSDDEATAIAVDGSGNVYVTGYSEGSGTWYDYATMKYNSAGGEEWFARYNGPGNDDDRAHAIAVDGSGNVYVTGESEGSDTYYDYATVKYNSEGEDEWVARYDGPANSYDWATAIAVDGSGNVYVTGYSCGSGTWDDYATVKYNSEGVEQWVARYNGPGNSVDWAYAIAVDGSGNVYVTGYSCGSGTGDDYATVKYNSGGVEQWVARYNGPGNSWDKVTAIAVDGSGNVYVTGESRGSGTWDDYATVKYNSEGQEQWVARYNGSGNYEDKANAIAVDGSGNVYVTGYSEGDYATVKYNSEGAQQWVARYDGPGIYNDYARAIAVDGSGDVYVTGESGGSGTEDDYATVKYNSSGEEEWVARYDGPGNSYDGATAIAVDGSGNVYVTGSSYNSDIEDDCDYATVKYNSAGVEEWVARYDGPVNFLDYAYAIAVDGSGNVYVTGTSVDSATYYDYATVKYNSEGQEQWVARYNEPGNSYDGATAIAIDGSGNVYVTGYSRGGNWSWSIYTTIKYSGDIGIENEDTNLPETLYLGNNYPNPFNSSTTIQYTLPRREYVRLAIYNISGQLVNTVENGVRSVGVHTAIWDGTDEQGRSVTNGIYFYKLEAGGKTFVKKMILMR